jgi:hypothetical protein
MKKSEHIKLSEEKVLVPLKFKEIEQNKIIEIEPLEKNIPSPNGSIYFSEEDGASLKEFEKTLKEKVGDLKICTNKGSSNDVCIWVESLDVEVLKKLENKTYIFEYCDIFDEDEEGEGDCDCDWIETQIKFLKIE